MTGLDSTNQRQEVLDLPVHLEDALRRVESAGVAARDSAGLAICGMGGSGVGGLLAAGIIGDRARRPIVSVRDYAPPHWIDADWTVLLSSYSGGTEETLACWDATEASRRIVTSTGGEIADRARAAEVPVILLPEGFQPRAAVGYATVVALEVAALAGVTGSLRDEVTAAAAFVAAEAGAIEAQAQELAQRIGSSVPVFSGAGLTVPAAYRAKCQMNENANRAAFWSELPEADHNEIEGWRDRSSLVPVFLEDPVDTHPRVQRRFDLTADIAGGALRVAAEGGSRSERLLWLVLLVDLMSLHLALNDGTDPVDIPALEDLKDRL